MIWTLLKDCVKKKTRLNIMELIEGITREKDGWNSGTIIARYCK
jgi:hypothetical protein